MSRGTLEIMGISWSDLLVVGLPAFGFGVFIGVISERRKGEVMGYIRPARTWFDRWAPALYMVVAVLALIGIFVSTAATITNGRQDTERAAEAKARDDQQRALLGCFDDFATALAGSLPPVREASSARDEAAAKRDDALQELVTLIVRNSTQPPVDEATARQQFIAAATRLRNSGRDLEVAQLELAQARADNPYPEPPSKFCRLQS